MGYFSHIYIQQHSLVSAGGEDQMFLFYIHNNFLIQHVLEPTRGEDALDKVLSSQH